MKKRIYFSAWGRGRWQAPQYAMCSSGGYESVAVAIAEAIARKSRLCVVTLRQDGVALPEGHPHYQVTLGTPCRGGGWTPRAELWFAYDPTQVSSETAESDSRKKTD